VESFDEFPEILKLGGIFPPIFQQATLFKRTMLHVVHTIENMTEYPG
jgi:hypothetical protein